jgi:hypothetical protein
MSIEQIDKSVWSSFFNRLSKQLDGLRAEVEVASLDLGDQIAAKWIPILGITYDRKDDLIEVALEGVDHLITMPVSVNVDFEGARVAAIEVTSADGSKQIVKLHEPLALPAPAGA